jgi:subtilisin
MANDIQHCAGSMGEEYTGRYIVTFREEAVEEGLQLLSDSAGVRNLPVTSDFADAAWDMAAIESANGAVYQNIGIALIEAGEDAIGQLNISVAGGESPILTIEPEMVMYAIQEEGPPQADLPLHYIKGYRDGIESLYQKLVSGESASAIAATAAQVYNDTAQATWGLQATGVMNSKYTGRGIRIAVLDTGMDLNHPDFRGRRIVSSSFVAGQPVQDGNGHGTHCIGASCGNRSNTGRRYGIAFGCEIYVGKVLSNAGSGPDSNILAGIDWAIGNQCQVVSMSLGAPVCTTSQAYEQAGRRALERGTLIVAAAGNTARRAAGVYSCVNRPANSKSMMAVAALDNRLQIANFSARSSGIAGGEVDIAGPGVDVFSSWPMNTRYNTISGTSMATPHVAGIAGLFAEASRARGFQLWQLLVSHARRLPLPSVDVGTGIVQAP